jgi:DNA polymerase-3 subunit alpha
MVTAAEHRMSKTGRPFGTVTLEDYSGSKRFMLFGEDYVKFREFLVDGWFLFVKGQIQEKRFRGADELEFKFTRVELLTDIKEKMIRRLRIQLDLERLDEKLVGEVATLVETHPGKTGLTFEVIEQGKALDMPARKTKVAVDKGLTDALDSLQGVHWKIQGQK